MNLQQFISDNKELINSNNFLNIFKKANEYNLGSQMNELFIKAGINPLEDLDYIPNYYFSGSDITDIVIPNDMRVIGRGSFFDCKSLSSVTIPNSVTQIKTVAFYGCTQLKYINYRGTRADWRLIELGKDWRGNTLYRCVVHCIDGNIDL